MFQSRPAVARRRGFTLVELLVVIGIIALLISILLPSLNSARQSAKTVKCLANLRSIGQGITLYANASRGSLPYGQWDGVGTGPDGTFAAPNVNTSDWATLLNGVAMDNTGNVTYGDLKDANSDISEAFQCPSAVPGNSAPEFRTLHYASHPRLMPDLDDADQSKAGTPLMQPYKISRIQDSSQIALIWDGAQRLSSNGPEGDGNANAVGRGVDGDGLFRSDTENGHTFNFLLRGDLISPGGAPRAGEVDLTLPVFAANKDWVDGNYDPVATSDIRWRHGRNNTANFVYADGHADTQRLKFGVDASFRLANLYVNR